LISLGVKKIWLWCKSLPKERALVCSVASIITFNQSLPAHHVQSKFTAGKKNSQTKQGARYTRKK